MKKDMHGIKVYKSFKSYLKELSSSLEKEHTTIHNEHVRKIREAAKNVTKGIP